MNESKSPEVMNNEQMPIRGSRDYGLKDSCIQRNRTLKLFHWMKETKSKDPDGVEIAF
jgi:hypothetical protein